ncbi:unnamed protein product [Callosobruchus maculatus]|uniref:Uncharacterized protein n=1 Tax=Callosobruchus maculatus TaxID=64391 RepID=A0A653D431_CALMS|nr:unnamed protein product [Callosobruchus maculatus]
MLTKDLLPSFEDATFQAYGSVLLDYSYHLRRTGNKEKAIEVNLKLLQLLQPRKAAYVYLHHEAAMQRLGYLTEVPEPENYGSRSVSPIFDVQPFQIPSFVSHSKSCICVFCSCLQYQILVLEKASQSGVVVTPELTADELEPPKVTLKKIPFHLSPSPDRRAKTPAAKKYSSVSTPAANKIPIFVDAPSNKRGWMHYRVTWSL